MSFTVKAQSDVDIASKVRDCLSCQLPFNSAWAGERICPKCKHKSIWRSGSARLGGYKS
jgi:predicted RNA-binding Zn-ribbon protein involved in translation (DUF1610 family)